MSVATKPGQTELTVMPKRAIGDLPRVYPATRHVVATAGMPSDLTMAKRNYLVEGLSGVGKTSVYEELIRRGYTAINTDRAWAYSADPETGMPGSVGHDSWMWDQRAAVSELEAPEPEVLFVCGSARNSDRFLPYFTKVFNLQIDDDTMRRRLEARTDDDWPLGEEGVGLTTLLVGARRSRCGAALIGLAAGGEEQGPDQGQAVEDGAQSCAARGAVHDRSCRSG